MDRTRRSPRNSSVRFWRADDLQSVEMLHADFLHRRSARHAHEGYEIAVIERGVMRLHHRGSSYVAGPGDLVVVNPDQAHAESNGGDEGWTARAIFPSIDNLCDATSALSARGGAPHFSSPVIRDPGLGSRILRMHRLLERGSSTLARETAAIEAAVSLVSRHALRREPTALPRAPAAVRRAVEFLEANFARNVSLAELVGEVGLSGFHLTRLFTAHTGFPPHAYLTRVRLRHARSLLARGTAAGQAAVDVGFSDQAHLTRTFRWAYGVTPGQFAAARSFNS